MNNAPMSKLGAEAGQTGARVLAAFIVGSAITNGGSGNHYTFHSKDGTDYEFDTPSLSGHEFTLANIKAFGHGDFF